MPLVFHVNVLKKNTRQRHVFKNTVKLYYVNMTHVIDAIAFIVAVVAKGDVRAR